MLVLRMLPAVGPREPTGTAGGCFPFIYNPLNCPAGRGCSPHSVDQGAWLRGLGGRGASPRPPELGRWPSRSGFRAPALPAATLSLIGSCRQGSLMEFNFQQEGWVGSRLAPVTLIKCLGKPGPPLILPPPPRPLLPAELRAEPGEAWGWLDFPAARLVLACAHHQSKPL